MALQPSCVTARPLPRHLILVRERVRARARGARVAGVVMGGGDKDAIVLAGIGAVSSIPPTLPSTTTTIAAVKDCHCHCHMLVYARRYLKYLGLTPLLYPPY